MNDRELLELAAKAAGIEVEWSDITGCFWSDGDSWVPLTDDGDALRLAVKLGLCVRIDNRVGFSWVRVLKVAHHMTTTPTQQPDEQSCEQRQLLESHYERSR